MSMQLPWQKSPKCTWTLFEVARRRYGKIKYAQQKRNGYFNLAWCYLQLQLNYIMSLLHWVFIPPIPLRVHACVGYVGCFQNNALCKHVPGYRVCGHISVELKGVANCILFAPSLNLWIAEPSVRRLSTLRIISIACLLSPSFSQCPVQNRHKECIRCVGYPSRNVGDWVMKQIAVCYSLEFHRDVTTHSIVRHMFTQCITLETPYISHTCMHSQAYRRNKNSV